MGPNSRRDRPWRLLSPWGLALALAALGTCGCGLSDVDSIHAPMIESDDPEGSVHDRAAHEHSDDDHAAHDHAAHEHAAGEDAHHEQDRQDEATHAHDGEAHEENAHEHGGEAQSEEQSGKHDHGDHNHDGVLGPDALPAGSTVPDDGFDWRLPAGFPVPAVPQDNPMTAQKVELGRYLFYDKRLSHNRTQSCASCHEQERAFTDAKVVSVGSTGDLTPRNSMSLANVAYAPTLTWGHPHLASLERQVLIPLFGDVPVELGLRSRRELEKRLAETALYADLFSAAFPEDEQPLSLLNAARALGAFQRTLLSGNAPVDRWLRGEDNSAISESAKRGFDLFNSEKLECFHCHAGFNYTDHVRYRDQAFASKPFHNTGLYNIDGAGAFPEPNTGVHSVSLIADDMGRFKAPTLRNIAVTAPYMHDGSIATLSEVLDHYAAGGRTIETGPYAGVGSQSPRKSDLVRGFELSEQERRDVLEFLESLTDDGFLADPRFSDPWPPLPSASGSDAGASVPGQGSSGEGAEAGAVADAGAGSDGSGQMDPRCPQLAASEPERRVIVGSAIELSLANPQAQAHALWSIDSGVVQTSASGELRLTCSGVGELQVTLSSALEGCQPTSVRVLCEAPELRQVRIRFAAEVGGSPVECGVDYPGLGHAGVTARVRDFRFFVSEVELIDRQGRSEPVTLIDRPDLQAEGVALLSFREGQTTCASGLVNTELHGRAPAGDYDGVAFTIGVPDALNFANPFEQPEPLGVSPLYWSWSDGYRFMMAEIAAGFDKAVLHLGSHSTLPNRPRIRLTGFDPLAGEVVADLGALFSGVELSALSSECHSTSDVCEPMFAALGVELETGRPRRQQRVFSGRVR